MNMQHHSDLMNALMATGMKTFQANTLARAILQGTMTDKSVADLSAAIRKDS